MKKNKVGTIKQHPTQCDIIKTGGRIRLSQNVAYLIEATMESHTYPSGDVNYGICSMALHVSSHLPKAMVIMHQFKINCQEKL